MSDDPYPSKLMLKKIEQDGSVAKFSFQVILKEGEAGIVLEELQVSVALDQPSLTPENLSPAMYAAYREVRDRFHELSQFAEAVANQR